MNDRRLVTIGIITKTHGFDGSVAVKVTASGACEPKINEPVFIVIDGIPVPFFVRDYYYSGGDTMIISFDDYDSPEKVLMLKGSEIRCEAAGAGEDTYLTLEGYTLSDVNSDFSGVIVMITEQPLQLLATVMAGGRQQLIPLHKDLIVSVNHRKKQIKIAMPEGLADLNN